MNTSEKSPAVGTSAGGISTPIIHRPTTQAQPSNGPGGLHRSPDETDLRLTRQEALDNFSLGSLLILTRRKLGLVDGDTALAKLDEQHAKYQTAMENARASK